MDVYTSMVGAGLAVSFLHAILPNHWLPFVLAGRAQKWSLAKTLSIVIVAGGGHVLITTVLGLLVVSLGMAVSHFVEEWSALIAGGILIAFGLFYLVGHFRGRGHSHIHLFGGHSHGEAGGRRQEAEGETGHAAAQAHSHDEAGEHDHAAEHELHAHSHDEAGEHDHDHGHHHHQMTRSDTVPVLSLVAMLTFSPCEGFLPIYLTAWPHGWTAFIVLSVVLAAGTLAGMIAFTWLTFRGMEKVSFPALERYEGLVLAVVLIGLGIGVMAFHDHV